MRGMRAVDRRRVRARTPQHSAAAATTDQTPQKHSAGRRSRDPGRKAYNHCNKPVLRRPVDSTSCTMAGGDPQRRARTRTEWEHVFAFMRPVAQRFGQKGLRFVVDSTDDTQPSRTNASSA